MNIGRPSTKSQPSRKGRKAWRKNVDIDDIEQGLEDAREMERVSGVKMGDEDGNDTALFTIDTEGDEALVPRKMREQKPLKATEILARRSAVPALQAPHKKQEQVKSKAKGIDGVATHEVERLMKVAGRKVGHSATKAMVDKDGMTSTETFDLWGGDDQTSKKSKKQDKKPKPSTKDYSFLHDLKAQTSFTKPANKPETMDRAPINFLGEELARAIVAPDAGKSYNPDEEEWLDLLKREVEREQAREDERLKLQAEKDRIEEIMRTLPDDYDPLNEEDDDEDEEEDEEEEEAGNDGVLSLNAPVKKKKKTPAQKAKQRRHKEHLEMQKRVKDIKQQIRDLHDLPKLIREEMEKLQQQRDERDKGDQVGKKRKKKLGKYHIKEGPLEIKLSDELTSTLRRLKPEGNLTSERFRSLQQRGLIEARVRVPKRRRYQQKVTEKWTYKDFK